MTATATVREQDPIHDQQPGQGRLVVKMRSVKPPRSSPTATLALSNMSYGHRRRRIRQPARTFGLRQVDRRCASLPGPWAVPRGGAGRDRLAELAASIRAACPEGDVGLRRFQEPTLMPWQAVFGQRYLPLRLRGQSKQASRERDMEGARMVGLAEFRRAPIRANCRAA